MREVHIHPVLNGFVVKVGCTEVVFRDIDELCLELKRYQHFPAAIEKEYKAKAINHIPDMEPPVRAAEGGEGRLPQEVGETAPV